MTVLISFAGLPGTGKTTIARTLSVAVGAVYLRIDAIDAAIWAIDPTRDIGPESYHIAAALAVSNLGLGHTTIIDCVNPWAVTRRIFCDAAHRATVPMLSIETVCSDQALHRMRVESRTPDIPGLDTPAWESVIARDYQAWDTADMRFDTARIDVQQAVGKIVRKLRTMEETAVQRQGA